MSTHFAVVSVGNSAHRGGLGSSARSYGSNRNSICVAAIVSTSEPIKKSPVFVCSNESVLATLPTAGAAQANNSASSMRKSSASGFLTHAVDQTRWIFPPQTLEDFLS